MQTNCNHLLKICAFIGGYLWLSGTKLAYLVNFNTDRLSENIIRYAYKL